MNREVEFEKKINFRQPLANRERLLSCKPLRKDSWFENYTLTYFSEESY